MKYLLLLVALTLSIGCSDGCAKAPPNLTPEASAAFRGLQVVKALDVLREVAIEANKQTPPLLSEDVTRKVVTYHQSAVKVIQASPGGWVPAVQTGLDELLKDLPQKEKALLTPYVTLLKTVIAEVTNG